jgi:hypothetical protein
MFYFAKDFILIIIKTKKIKSQKKYLIQKEWSDFCEQRQNFTKWTMKKI